MRRAALFIGLLVCSLSAFAPTPFVPPPTRPNQDYVKDTAQAGTDATNTWTNGVTNFFEGVALTANRRRNLPATSSYADGSLIKYYDGLTASTDPTQTFGPAFVPSGSDTLKGSNASTWTSPGPGYQPFVGAGYGGGARTITFQKKGTDWQVYSLGGENLMITAIQNPSNLAGMAVFDPSLLTGLRAIAMPDGAMALVADSDPNEPGVVTDILGGLPIKGPIYWTQIFPKEDIVGATGVDYGPTSHLVPAGTSTVRIAGNLIAPLQLKWPAANGYDSGKDVTLIDASGTISIGNPVTVVPNNGTDYFNDPAADSFLVDEAFVRKVFTSNGADGWTAPLAKASIQPFTVYAATSSVFTVPANPNAAKTNAHITLGNGANTLKVTNPFDGMSIEVVAAQPASGSAGTLLLPAGSRTPTGGGGMVTLTATNGAVDRLRGIYDGTLNAFLWDAPILNETTTSAPTAPTSLTATASGSSIINLSWTDNASNETGFDIQRASGISGTSWNSLTSVGPVTGTGGTGTYSDTGLSPTTSWNYRVRATNAGANSTFATAAGGGATTGAGAATADILEWHFNNGSGSNVTATVGPDGTLSPTAGWVANGSFFAFHAIAGMANVAPTISIVGATGGTTTYSYRVLAWKTSGQHNAAPANVTTTVAQAVLNSANRVSLSWSAVTGADTYAVYRMTAPQGQIGNGITGTTFDDTGPLAADCTSHQTACGVVNGSTPGNLTSTDISTATANAPVTFGSDRITVSFWAKSTYTTGGNNDIVAAGTNCFRIEQQNGSPNRFLVTFPGGTTTTHATGWTSNTVTSNGSAINSGANYHHIVVELDNHNSTWSSTDIQFFFDKGSAITPTYTDNSRNGAALFPPATPILGSNFFIGDVDDVRIYGRLLNTTEISDIFDAGPQ